MIVTKSAALAKLLAIIGINLSPASTRAGCLPELKNALIKSAPNNSLIIPTILSFAHVGSVSVGHIIDILLLSDRFV